MEKVTNPNYVKLQSKSSLGPKTSLKKALPQCPHVCLCLFPLSVFFPLSSSFSPVVRLFCGRCYTPVHAGSVPSSSNQPPAVYNEHPATRSQVTVVPHSGFSSGSGCFWSSLSYFWFTAAGRLSNDGPQQHVVHLITECKRLLCTHHSVSV